MSYFWLGIFTLVGIKLLKTKIMGEGDFFFSFSDPRFLRKQYSNGIFAKKLKKQVFFTE
jgi:hypothetical protein